VNDQLTIFSRNDEQNQNLARSQELPKTELIKIENREGKETVNARDLHEFLESRQEFANWITSRIETYGFIFGIDFLTILSKSNGGRPSKEFYISIDMAKELSMVERNQKGRQIRKWFIDRDNKLKSIESKLPATFAEALQLAADQALKIEQQAGQLEQAKPAIYFHEKVGDSSGLHTVAEVAKMLGTGRNRLFEKLRNENILRDNNEPYQRYIESGYFEVKENPCNEHVNAQTFVTAKGLQWLQGRG